MQPSQDEHRRTAPKIYLVTKRRGWRKRRRKKEERRKEDVRERAMEGVCGSVVAQVYIIGAHNRLSLLF